MKYQSKRKALILLEDGTIFYGKAVGNNEGTAYGEVCFNTGMTGVGRMFYRFTLWRDPDSAALHPGYRWVHRNAFFLVPCTSPLVPVTQHNVYYVK